MRIGEGVVRPIRDNIIVCDIEFGMEKTPGGVLLLSDDGKKSGIHPRWGKVYAVGPRQKDVLPGEWILMEHGRWSRGIEYTAKSGEELLIHLVDNKGIMAVADEKPVAVQRSVEFGAGSNINFNIPGA